MKMKAIGNGDTIAIVKDPRANYDRTIAVFEPDRNTLTMSQGQDGNLRMAIQALRVYQRERNLPIAPVRVEYW